MRQGRVVDATFGIFLNGSNGGNVIQNGGELTLGGYNSSYVIGSLSWFSVPIMPAFVNYRYFWALSLQRMAFSGSYTSTYNPGTAAYVVFDTGKYLQFWQTI